MNNKPADILDQEIIDALGGLEPLRATANAGELTDEQYDKLFDLLQNDMPYGTQKARTGDPHEWIMHRLLNLNARLIPSEPYHPENPCKGFIKRVETW
jgi:hypothetical protein